MTNYEIPEEPDLDYQKLLTEIQDAQLRAYIVKEFEQYKAEGYSKELLVAMFPEMYFWQEAKE